MNWLKRFKYWIAAALVLAVPVGLAAQSFLTEIQGAGMMFRSQDPVIRFAGNMDWETLGAVDILRLEADGDLVFEGTADGFELTLEVADPTADRTVTIPEETGAVMMSSLATNATDVVNSVTGASNNLVFEGATADAFETSITVTDPTADRTVTFPNETGAPMMSSLATNGTDIANSWTGGTNTLISEGATADAFEGTITPQDWAADKAITLMDAAGAINVGFTQNILLCGQQENNSTNYGSPVTGFGAGALYDLGAAADSWQIGGDGCNAEDSTTEATADEVVSVNNAMKVLGMYCEVSGSGSNGVTLNVRSAAANLTPDVTITIATGNTTGATVAVSTTDIAAGATMAVRSVNTEDLSAQDWWCLVKVLMVP